MNLPDLNLLDQWMDAALSEAWRGVERGESPFGAAIYRPDGTQVSLQHNTVRSSGQLTRHAEMNAIDQAFCALDCRSLDGLVLVTTAEPCPMCAATAATAGIQQVVYGATAMQVRSAGISTLMTSCLEVYQSLGVDLNCIGGIRAPLCLQLLTGGA